MTDIDLLRRRVGYRLRVAQLHDNPALLYGTIAIMQQEIDDLWEVVAELRAIVATYQDQEEG